MNDNSLGGDTCYTADIKIYNSLITPIMSNIDGPREFVELFMLIMLTFN